MTESYFTGDAFIPERDGTSLPECLYGETFLKTLRLVFCVPLCYYTVMAHCTAAEAEKILDKEFRVLDKGFVRLVDYMGTDERIVQAARVSYGNGTKTAREDAALIDYLLRNKHTSPFEQVILTFHIKLPIFVARQWIRHRTARLNEISGRYSILTNEFYVPEPCDIALQSTDNKQGRRHEAVPDELGKSVIHALIRQQEAAYSVYKDLLDKNIARELARINLPLAAYTEWYWQIDLHNLFHFLRLRLDAHAQKEIRVYAETIFDICKKVAPLACESFGKYEKDGVSFSKEELDAIRNLIAGKESGLQGKELDRFNEKLKTGRQI